MTDDAELIFELARTDTEFEPMLLPGSRYEFQHYATRLAGAGFAVRRIRGRKCRTEGALFDEFAGALQFPWYFGENWDAFDECIQELDEAGTGSRTVEFGAGLVLAIEHADQLLEESPAEDLRLFWRLLSLASAAYADEDRELHIEKRAVIPFHAIMQADRADALRTRYGAAGIPVSTKFNR